MPEFQKLRLVDTHLFKDQAFRLDAKGLSVIYGRNKNANGNTNAAGKSLFFSMLPEIIFGSPSTGDARDKTRAGKRILHYKVGEDSYAVVNSFSPKEKLRIVKNGKDLEFRELAEARKFVLRTIGYTQEEFESLVYLDSRIPHPLVRGGTSARREFFTKFFRLDTASSIKELISSELRHVDRAKAKHAEVLSQLEDLPSMGEAAIRKRELAVSRWRKEAEALEEKAQKVRDRRIQYETLEAALPTSLLSELPDFEATEQKLRKAKSRLKVLREQAEQLRKYKEWAKEDKANKEEQRRLEALIEEASDEVDVDAIKVHYEKLETRQDDLLKKIRDLTHTLKNLRSKLRDLGSGVCSHCGQALPDRSTIVSQRADIEKKSSAIEQDLEKDNEALERVEKNLRRYESMLTKAHSASKARQFLAELRKSRKEAPVKPEFTEDDNIEKIEAFVTRASKVLEYQSKLEKYFQLKDLVTKDSDKDLEVLDALTALKDKISRIEYDIEEARRNGAKLEEIASRKAEYEKDIGREAGLKVLEKAYSKKGIQALMIASICSRLETLVNKFSKLVFVEKYTFSFTLDTQINITCTRNLNGKSLTSDVRKLSGSESTLFSLILLLALYSFLPQKRRSNLLILDEPDANMGEQTQESLIRFLTVLNKIIPHIVIITPRTDGVYEKAKFWTVVKSGSTSTIVEN